MPILVKPNVERCGVGVREIARRARGMPGHRKLAAPLFTTLEKATPTPTSRNQALPTHLRPAGDKPGMWQWRNFKDTKNLYRLMLDRFP